MLLNCDVDVFGELTSTDHTPAPTIGVLAANVAVELLHIVWSLPAVTTGVTVRVMVLVDVEHGALLVVHFNV